MPRPRRQLVSSSVTPYYHVSARCVRRAYLCGHDSETGQSFEHRRNWIEKRIGILTSLFSIDVCAYAIMSNHYHLVVKINPEKTASWPDEQVLNRWCRLFKGPVLVQRWLNGEILSKPEQQSVRSIASVYRKRFGSLSWFMKCLNEPIARQANREDQCTGHFWEARFHSQALISEQALLAAMAYVDLNPVRAGIAATPEASEYTSVRARILSNLHTDSRPPVALATCSQILSINTRTYLQVLDATGRLVAHGKRGKIEARIQPILQRLGFAEIEWAEASLRFRDVYSRGVIKVKKPA